MQEGVGGQTISYRISEAAVKYAKYLNFQSLGKFNEYEWKNLFGRSSRWLERSGFVWNGIARGEEPLQPERAIAYNFTALHIIHEQTLSVIVSMKQKPYIIFLSN